MKQINLPAVLLFLTCCVCSCNNNGQTHDGPPAPGIVFRSLKYDKVIAYKYVGKGGAEIVDSTGRLAEGIEKQVVLNGSQIIRFTNMLSKKSTYGGEVAICFHPNLGIVFYEADKPVAHVSISVDCNSLKSSLKMPNTESGFSDEGLKQIVDFEEDLGF